MEPLIWRAGDRELDCSSRTLVMGILNVTPDSFSDGGQFFDTEAAVRRGVDMAAEGADVVDVGGESTRPGSDAVSAEEERERVAPVVKRLAAEIDVPISIDTRKAQVAEVALEVGASIVNDVSAGGDPWMFDLVRAAEAGMVLMHMKGEPKTMQEAPHYEDVVGEVQAYLGDRLRAAEAVGIDRDRLVVDPGIGFGKTVEDNLVLLRHLDELSELGRPILVGPSRKSFIGRILDVDAGDRVEGTAAAVALAVTNGARVVRVHDVKEMVRVVRVVDAVVRG